MTSPWPAGLVTYRKRQHQKFEVYLTKGICVNPKAYCCDDNTINDQKPPVAVLTVTPNPIYEGENATLDLTGSYDPDGVGIADPAGYELWDGIGGNFPATKTQVVNYPNAGRYECIGVVVDGDGFYGQASVWIEVLSTNGDNPPEPPGDWRKKIYVATKVNGIYYTIDFSGIGGGNPEWTTLNTGLGATTTQSIVGDPWDPAGRQYTRTAEPKIYRRTGGNWSVILDATIVAATTGVAIGSQLIMMGPTGNINANGHIYALVSYHDGGILNYRVYFFKSVDYGDNWTAMLVEDDWFMSKPLVALRVGAFQGSSPYAAGQVIYAVFSTSTTAVGMRVSTDQGANWGARIGLYHCAITGHWVDLARSAADQDVIYQVGYGDTPPRYTLVKSINRGGAWTTIWACAVAPPSIAQRPNIYAWDPHDAYMAAGGVSVHYTGDDWASYVTRPNAIVFHVDGLSRVMDAPTYLYLWRDDDPAGGESQHVIGVSEDGGTTVEGKAGADPVTPGATSIPNNCGGVAGILQIWTED